MTPVTVDRQARQSGCVTAAHVTDPGCHGAERRQFTRVPDEFFRLLPQLGEAELKVLLYIIRRTYGFGKDRDAISYDQFLRGIRTRAG